MKKIYSIVAGLLLTASVFAQAPQKMSYQAVIRNSSSALVTSTSVGMKISVLQGSSTGTVAYSEIQTISTNANGLVSLEIGSGSALAGTFAGINWAIGPYFIKTETDPTGGTTYSITGTSQLMSVPYALFSASGTTGAQGIQGLPGANGTTGAIGATGSQGIQGLPGAIGTNGTIGATGLVGATGAAGTNGTNGLDGATGAAGTNGANGLDGATGAAGTNGTNGLDGAIGLTGATGTDGAPGAAGAAGTNGATGLTGAAGINGADGATGTSGTNGTDGATGLIGLTGLTGATGTAGATGATGIVGINGADGATGLAGIDGADGATGLTGPEGPQGNTGAAGAANISWSIDAGDNITNTNSGYTAISSDLNVAGTTVLNGPTAIASDLNVGGNASGMLQPSSAAHLTRKDYVDAANAANVSILNDLIAALEARIVALEQEQLQQPATVGDFRVGGIVFWVDPADNTHGLVCAFQDTSIAEWGCYGIDLPNVPNVLYDAGNPTGIGAEIGDGINNTNSILNDCPSAPAALAARSLGPEWFLPSAKELEQMYINRTTLEAAPGFSAFSSFYWSSTEDGSTLACRFAFTNGLVFNLSKDFTLDVRGVRAF
jgi:hypothetical protein